jgi:hypothetical protein
MSYVCNECTKRNCRKEPQPIRKREGRYECKHFAPVRGSFSFLELCLDSSTHSTMLLLEKANLTIIETKKGLKVATRP